jgi:hypothetical protein
LHNFEISDFVSGRLGILQGEPRFPERNGCYAGVPGLPTNIRSTSELSAPSEMLILIFSTGRAFAETPTIVRLEPKLLEEERRVTFSLVYLLRVQIEETKCYHESKKYVDCIELYSIQRIQ